MRISRNSLVLILLIQIERETGPQARSEKSGTDHDIDVAGRPLLAGRGALAMGCSRPKTESMEFWADELMSVSGAKAVTGKPRVQSIMKWTVSDVSAVSLNQQLSIVKYHPRH